MKQTNINIDEIKRFPTVTNPIKADDLHTPQAYAFTLRRAIVTDCNDRQRAALVELLDGKDTAEGVTFNNTKVNRDRLHIWQNQESRRERAAILGEGWQYSGNLNDGTPHANPGDEITCVDGTTGICTKASPEIVCIEFETADGRALTVAGYFFRKERTPLEQGGEITEAEGIKVGDKVKHVWSDEVATVTAIRKDYWDAQDGKVWLFTLDYGKDTRGEWKTVLGPFKMDLNGKEFRREALTLCNPSEIKAAHEEQKRELGQAFDAEYYKPILEAIEGRKVFHFGIPADTVRIEVKRECKGFYRIRMKRAAAEYVESMSEYIDWETVLNTDRAARLLSDYRADHRRAHRFGLGDLVRVNDPEWKQVNGHVGRITKMCLINQFLGTIYTVEFVGELPKYNDGQPMKDNDFEPLDIEPTA